MSYYVYSAELVIFSHWQYWWTDSESIKSLKRWPSSCGSVVWQHFSSIQNEILFVHFYHDNEIWLVMILINLGLRGAISYALSLHLGFSDETRHVIITTTLIIVLFTTLIFGGSTLPLLKFLRVSCWFITYLTNFWYMQLNKIKNVFV